jgi:hypothetical protein
MYFLYSSEIRGILNRCKLINGIPYELRGNEFVLINCPKYLKMYSRLVQFNWIHAVATGLSLWLAIVRIEDMEIQLLALAVAALYFVSTLCRTIHGKKDRVREIIGVLNTLSKLGSDNGLLLKGESRLNKSNIFVSI